MSDKTNIHLLGVPHTVTNSEYLMCAYTQKIVKFAKMFANHPEYNLIHYGHEDSVLDSSVEMVTCTTNQDMIDSYGDHDWRSTFFKFDPLNDKIYHQFYMNATDGISERFKGNDIILPFWGAGVKTVCDAIEKRHPDAIIIEPGIGYGEGSWSTFKVFESYAIMHATQGSKMVCRCNPRWYEVVIPNYFDDDEFTYSDEKDDYFLYIGRVYKGKGVDLAADACIRAGVKLKIYGQKDPDFKLPESDLIEYCGSADLETRKNLMARAKGSLLPSQYIEPFGGVMVENFLSGTPMITTDWGAFSEYNIHGKTGYRCRNMGDFVEAIERVKRGEISSQDCRDQGEKFLLENIRPLYEKYFRDVLNVYQGERTGWYETENRFMVV